MCVHVCMHVLVCVRMCVTYRVLRQSRQHLTKSVIHLLAIAFKEFATPCTEESVSSEDHFVFRAIAGHVVTDMSTGVARSGQTAYREATHLRGSKPCDSMWKEVLMRRWSKLLIMMLTATLHVLGKESSNTYATHTQTGNYTFC